MTARSWETSGAWQEALRLLIGDLEVVRLIDRDDRSSDEISDHAGKGVRVLSRRNLESYIFDDEVLQALAKSVDGEDKTAEPASGKATHPCRQDRRAKG